MEHGSALGFLKEILLVLGAAGILVPVLQRLGLSAILGYLIAGILIGPFGLGRLVHDVPVLEYVTISDVEGIAHLAELGVVLLLFMVGLELSLSRLWSLRQLVFGLGGAQVVVTAVVIGLVATALGLTTNAAIAIGASLALSSTAIVVELLVERRRLSSPPGRATFSTLLFQDLAVVPVLFVIGTLGATGSENVVLSLALSLGGAALAIGVILAAGRVVIEPAFRLIGGSRNRDVFTAAALLVILGTAVATAAAGLSMALGAFLAGLVFADTEFRHQIEADVEPFKGLFLGLFFLSVGMTIDPLIILSDPLTVLALVVGIMVVKALIVIAIALLMRLPLSIAVEAGLLLSQIGEFSLVGLALAAGLGVIDRELQSLLVVAVGATMALTPIIAGPAERLGRLLESRGTMKALGAELTSELGWRGHVIVAGYGRIGRMIGSILEAQRTEYLAVDLDSRNVATGRKDGAPVYFGDVRREEVLRNAGLQDASALILTMDNPAANEAVIATIRRAGLDHIPVVARARDAAHAENLYALGVDEVVLETLEASLQLSEATLRSLGLPPDAARMAVAERRESERMALEGTVDGSARTRRREARSAARTDGAGPD